MSSPQPVSLTAFQNTLLDTVIQKATDKEEALKAIGLLAQGKHLPTDITTRSEVQGKINAKFPATISALNQQITQATTGSNQAGGQPAVRSQNWAKRIAKGAFKVIDVVGTSLATAVVSNKASKEAGFGAVDYSNQENYESIALLWLVIRGSAEVIRTLNKKSPIQRMEPPASDEQQNKKTGTDFSSPKKTEKAEDTPSISPVEDSESENDDVDAVPRLHLNLPPVLKKNLQEKQRFSEMPEKPSDLPVEDSDDEDGDLSHRELTSPPAKTLTERRRRDGLPNLLPSNPNIASKIQEDLHIDTGYERDDESSDIEDNPPLAASPQNRLSPLTELRTSLHTSLEPEAPINKKKTLNSPQGSPIATPRFNQNEDGTQVLIVNNQFPLNKKKDAPLLAIGSNMDLKFGKKEKENDVLILARAVPPTPPQQGTVNRKGKAPEKGSLKSLHSETETLNINPTNPNSLKSRQPQKFTF